MQPSEALFDPVKQQVVQILVEDKVRQQARALETAGGSSPTGPGLPCHRRLVRRVTLQKHRPDHPAQIDIAGLFFQRHSDFLADPPPRFRLRLHRQGQDTSSCTNWWIGNRSARVTWRCVRRPPLWGWAAGLLQSLLLPVRGLAPPGPLPVRFRS